MLIEISPFPLRRSVSDPIGRFGIVLLGPNHTVVDRILLLLEQILEDEVAPSAAACVHQHATFVELSQLDGANPSCLANPPRERLRPRRRSTERRPGGPPRRPDLQPGWPQPGD